MRKQFLLVLLVMGLTLGLVACTSHLTVDDVSKVKSGMTSTEVKAILGNPTQTDSQTVIGLSGSTYVYRRGESEVKVVFVNDKVTAVQSHLK